MQTITAFTKDDFRKWLQEHHLTEKKVRIILHKRHTGKSAPTHRELLEEAIFFGWIDTTLKRLDENQYQRNFVKRNEKSKWSENTLGYAKELLKSGRMSAEGIKYYKLGLKTPTHDAGIPKNPEMPEELAIVLRKNKKAKHFFDKYPPSHKKMLYRWILHAKLPETRAKRIQKIIEGAQKEKRIM